jgi:hypothetical protein
MNRREILRLFLAGAFGSDRLLRVPPRAGAQETGFASRWQDWPDVRWAGPECWGNRLQDWAIRDGRVLCRVRGPNRTLHCLTHQVVRPEFRTSVLIDPGSPPGAGADADARIGFRLGLVGRFEDYRSAAVHGVGLDVGLDGSGRLVVGEVRSSVRVSRAGALRLQARVQPSGSRARVELSAHAPDGGAPLATLQTEVDASSLVGNVALVSHQPGASPGPGPAATFGDWRITGPGLDGDPDRGFGPIAFAQYTLHRGTLKLTAQLAPLDEISGLRAVLETRAGGGGWQERGTAVVDRLSRTARFRVDGWDGRRSAEYRVRLAIPLRGGPERYEYRGTIAAVPEAGAPVRAAVFSCNADHGFPDAEVVHHVGRHDPDVAFFLGDQFYEGSGGFGIQTDSVDEAALDMLHKWYMFGWSYREIFRHIPAAFIPDDHDVYHGNVWGEGGKVAPTDQGWGAVAQDQGGYKMPAEWVNAVQVARLSHLPDPYDPTPVEQGIGVYYCQWDWGGVSFAVLEDRKFKSAPANVLPAEARVVNGWIQNPDFDVREHPDPPGASLLGERQMRFLEDWSRDWSGSTYLKVALSQTNFAAVHTIPADATSGAVLPSLPMPAPGEYVRGDKLAVDMDSNGWPRARRDDALRVLRRCAAFHIAGDQHLATVVRHGIEDFEDAGFSFTGPALNNIWPRRWWPPADARVAPLDGGPPYTGRFRDGFGNRITVHAAANPRDTGLEPRIIRDRVTGYGIVTFHPSEQRIEVECWPRHVDPAAPGARQYEGWPVAVDAGSGDGREPEGFLPTVRTLGLRDPVVEVVDGGGGVLYTRRVLGTSFRPPVFGPGPHRVRVGDPDSGTWQEREVGDEGRTAGELVFDFR